jgi:hypothetical protein
MSKLKININKKEPPAHIIRKYKNADNFMSVYKKLHKPSGIREMFVKDKVKMSMIAVLLMLLLMWVLSDENLKPEDEKPRNKIELKE